MCHFGHICHNLICTYWVQLNGYAAVSLQAVNCCLHLGASAAVANRLLYTPTGAPAHEFDIKVTYVGVLDGGSSTSSIMLVFYAHIQT